MRVVGETTNERGWATRCCLITTLAGETRATVPCQMWGAVASGGTAARNVAAPVVLVVTVMSSPAERAPNGRRTFPTTISAAGATVIRRSCPAWRSTTCDTSVATSLPRQVPARDEDGA